MRYHAAEVATKFLAVDSEVVYDSNGDKLEKASQEFGSVFAKNVNGVRLISLRENGNGV